MLQNISPLQNHFTIRSTVNCSPKRGVIKHNICIYNRPSIQYTFVVKSKLSQNKVIDVLYIARLLWGHEHATAINGAISISVYWSYVWCAVILYCCILY